MGAKISKPKAVESPPSYQSMTNIPGAGFQRTKIRASDVPRWHYTNAQCKEWVAAVLIEYCGRSKKCAEEKVCNFEGFGPALWRMEQGHWSKWLKHDGQSIYALLYEMYHYSKDAPKHIPIGHFLNEKENGKEGGNEDEKKVNLKN